MSTPPNLAQTPEPPYYAVIFTSKRTEGDAGYDAMAQRMVELGSRYDGFLGIESARGADGLGPMSAALFPQHIIARKRDGGALSRDEIFSFVGGATDGSWADYQLSALLMAIFLRGMSAEETVTLTEAMKTSGFVADLKSVR